MILRQGSPSDDAAAMAEIFNYYVVNSDVIFSNTLLSPEDMRAKLERLEAGTRYPFFVAEHEGRVAGYGYAHAYQPDPVYSGAWELTIYLAHDALGLGLGTRMLSALVDECRRLGAHTLISNITEGNAACEQMHLKAGFTLAGRLPQVGYKFGRWLSDVIYQIVFD